MSDLGNTQRVLTAIWGAFDTTPPPPCPGQYTHWALCPKDCYFPAYFKVTPKMSLSPSSLKMKDPHFAL